MKTMAASCLQLDHHSQYRLDVMSCSQHYWAKTNEKCTGCLIIGSLKFQLVVNDTMIFICPISPWGVSEEVKFLCVSDLSCRV